MDMHTVLASTVHDVKNSLGLMINQMDDVYKKLSEIDPETAKILRRMQLECGRINNDVVHMLGIYKLNNGLFSMSFDEVYVPDVIADVTSRYRELLNLMDIKLEVHFGDEDCVWYLDATLIEGLLANVLTNSIRYTRQFLRFDIQQQGGWLNIRIADDGNGFPPAMLNMLTQPESVCFESGATGLGVYFCQQIAQAHTNGARKGYIQLSNDEKTGGAIFDLWLP